MAISRRRLIATAAAATGLAAAVSRARMALGRSVIGSMSTAGFRHFREYPDALLGPSVQIGIRWSRDRSGPCPATLDALVAFNGEVAFDLANRNPRVRWCDAVFSEIDDDAARYGFPSPPAVVVACLDGRTGNETSRLAVHAASTVDPLLPHVLTTILAPAFAPGIVSVDWDDICALLGRGGSGLLTWVGGEPEEAWPVIHEVLDNALVELGSPAVVAALTVLFHRSPTLAQIRMGAAASQDLVGSDGLWLHAAPLLAEGDAACALLAITDCAFGHSLAG